MNYKQTFIIALSIVTAIISHAYITKPVPVNYSVRVPRQNPFNIHPGRYQVLVETKGFLRLDTFTGNLYSKNGKKYIEVKPIEE